ncbi:YkvA family protein [Deinococcus sp. QL22]|uniref:YkvA family protein n=1 Tax=Deinococcus sp. QL22 TaxID=2939437 RepID=UPI00201715E4|nr:DUF1232 domain-containing protein [Deinococcus sp. QL22]UQN07214.1 DUF1232 domain-containing protein [Deinococcus sp. QL22]
MSVPERVLAVHDGSRDASHIAVASGAAHLKAATTTHQHSRRNSEPPDRVSVGVIARIRPIWRDALALLFSLGDRRTPLPAKAAALVAIIYAVSPLDLLPDLTPLLGFGDDLVIVPTILALAARSLPAPVLLDARARSAGMQRRLPWLLPVLGVALVIGLGLLVWGLVRSLGG